MVSQLYVVIIKCTFDFPRVALGEVDPCGEPHPCKLRYATGNDSHLVGKGGLCFFNKDWTCTISSDIMKLACLS